MKFRRREGHVTKSPIVKRSVKIDGRKTSVGLEDAFWNALKQIAAYRKISIEKLVFKIDNEREHTNLSSAIRLFVLYYYCQQAAVRSARR
jgi:predicted DNA-binding ribbon-helix-helix protein